MHKTIEKKTYGLGILNRLKDFDSTKFAEIGKCQITFGTKIVTQKIIIDQDGKYDLRIIVTEKSAHEHVEIVVKKNVCDLFCNI